MRRWHGLIVVMMTMTIVGCGGSKRDESASSTLEKKAEQAQKSAEQMQNGAEQMAKGFAQMAKELSNAAGDPNAKPVDPVSFRDLQGVFPQDVSGWERSKPTGEHMSSPVNFSEAEVNYQKGDASVRLKITDSALNQLLVTPFAMFLAAGYEKETESGYEKSVKIEGYPGWEKWNDRDKDGELNAIVNKRFIVQLEGNHLENASVLHAFMQSTDLKKLASLQ